MTPTYLSYFAEYIGTFFFILSIFSSNGNPIVIGLALMLVIFLTAPHGAGHVNPAVSYSQFLASKLSMNGLIGYITAQLLGAVSAYYAYKMTK